MAPGKRRGKGRKQKKCEYYRKHLTQDQKTWLEGALLNNIDIKLNDLKINFQNRFNRPIKIPTLKRIKKQVQEQIILQKADQQSGRQRKKTNKQDKIILNTINTNNRNSWKQISDKLITEQNISVSVSTLRRRAREDGITSYLQLNKPFLNSEKAQKRLDYSIRIRKKLNEKKINLKNFVFTDETKIHIFESQIGGNAQVKCTSKERIDPNNITDLLNLEEEVYHFG